MSVDPKILAKSRDASVVPLEGSERQIKWAGSIRCDAAALSWPPKVWAKLARIKDATWWIANKGIVTTMKFKEPLPQQLSSGSPPAPEQPELPSTNGAPAVSADYIDAMTPLTGAPLVAPKRAKADDTMTDMERFAESVSHNPPMAKAAVIAALSVATKNPDVKAKLKRAGWQALGDAQCRIARDEDAIKRMLERP